MRHKPKGVDFRGDHTIVVRTPSSTDAMRFLGELENMVVGAWQRMNLPRDAAEILLGLYPWCEGDRDDELDPVKMEQQGMRIRMILAGQRPLSDLAEFCSREQGHPERFGVYYLRDLNRLYPVVDENIMAHYGDWDFDEAAAEGYASGTVMEAGRALATARPKIYRDVDNPRVRDTNPSSPTYRQYLPSTGTHREWTGEYGDGYLVSRIQLLTLLGIAIGEDNANAAIREWRGEMMDPLLQIPTNTLDVILPGAPVEETIHVISHETLPGGWQKLQVGNGDEVRWYALHYPTHTAYLWIPSTGWRQIG